MRTISRTHSIEQVFGVSPRLFIGRSPAEFILENQMLGTFHEPILRILAKESQKETVEFKFRPSKHEIWVETSIKPMVGPDGRIIRLVAISRDVTHRKRTEQQLREISTMKDKFLSIIAHDLKNPFNTLLGFSTLLKDNAGHYPVEKIKDFARDIYEAAQGGANLLS